MAAMAAAGALKLSALRDELAARLEAGDYLSLHRCRELSEQARASASAMTSQQRSLSETPRPCLPPAACSLTRRSRRCLRQVLAAVEAEGAEEFALLSSLAAQAAAQGVTRCFASCARHVRCLARACGPHHTRSRPACGAGVEDAPASAQELERHPLLETFTAFVE